MSKPFFILAPMDDVTDVVFRSVIEDTCPPDLFFTEFVNVDGLCSPGRPKLMHKLAIDKSAKTPVIAQIWGKKPENYTTIAHELVDMGFAGVDINMGCPQKNEVKNGCCSALINDRELASRIVQATKKGVNGKVPVSVKTRLGWNEIDLSWHEHLLNEGVDMLTVHMRTRKEMSAVPAHYEIMPEIIALRDKIAPHTTIVLNGDVEDRRHGEQLAEQMPGLDGVMIGRGVFRDPYCFSSHSPWKTKTRQEKLELYATHVERFASQWNKGERSPYSLRRFCKVYINGFDEASHIREAVMTTTTADELAEVLRKNID